MSCPYRLDAPSGLWHHEEYAKLPAYDRPTAEQPLGVFACHQADGRVCAGWAGCHDGEHLLSLRLGVLVGLIDADTAEAVRDYVSPVPLFDSGTAAALHGARDLLVPGRRARAMQERYARRRP